MILIISSIHDDTYTGGIALINGKMILIIAQLLTHVQSHKMNEWIADTDQIDWALRCKIYGSKMGHKSPFSNKSKRQFSLAGLVAFHSSIAGDKYWFDELRSWRPRNHSHTVCQLSIWKTLWSLRDAYKLAGTFWCISLAEKSTWKISSSTWKTESHSQFSKPRKSSNTRTFP